ncbi:MAG: GNAT family N-acetyltransferase [Halomonas sp.]|jgi:predicted GNAT family N-acyltransferase|uniref:GNAT family N-acetyltransferase n=1 Tax=Billgrantia tianxiuensis TaxID=2497861 RepID=A0A6I6SPT9_9GAMM|nr:MULTISPECIES: GNAT family N-acetyltransferase [Halomonas]MCE8032502.1 GNAT family N-acetyltransferase [Halomonas sp. MCCC 1A11057]MDX5432665.1 GNAT family N-acetyltransferase [Halomonas sp.]MDX5502415.1 GNAT family N-acetyltransferase [Halomonas sp.]QHC49547.1 GNAT family N-acetyltransferase [Halomonas tianxiuensis]
MTHRIVVKEGSWEELGDLAGEIRRVVFIEEQRVPLEEEWDGRDDECRHFLALRGNSALGTARLLPDGHVGRVAVLREARGLGIGAALMQAAIDTARRLGHAQVELAAQTHALAFYENLGFVAFGEVFMDAGIPHRNMRLSL